MGGIAGHMFVDMPADRTGYLHKASLLQDMSAVTAACLLMKKEVFEQAGGFTDMIPMRSFIIWNQRPEELRTARRKCAVFRRRLNICDVTG